MGIMFILCAVLALVVWWMGHVMYSLFFSPLKDLPSPLIFQVFPIYLQIRMAMGDAPFLVHSYFLEYGPVFRMGWRLVFFVDAGASTEIYSTYKFSKTTDYNMFRYFGQNVLSTQDRVQHSARRRQIAPAFTRQSVAEMEPAIIQWGVAPLLDNLTKAANKEEPIDIFHQLHFFSWDVIGKLVFGESFHMLQLGPHPAVQWLDSIVAFGVIGILFPFLRNFKIPAGENLRKFSNELLDRHYKRKAEEPSLETQGDIISHFTHPKSIAHEPLDRQSVLAETFVQLFAGTDSTSNTLTWFFYLVLSNPNVEKKLMLELKENGLLDRPGILKSADYNLKLPYLEATMKESMRFLPVVPNTPFRIVPEGGRRIMGHFIPEGTPVAIPLYSLNRSPELWPDCDSFIPERWENTKPKEGSFIPFLLGPRGCIGKDIAWLELYLIAVNVLVNFRLTLVEDPAKMEFSCMPTLRPKANQLYVKVQLQTPPALTEQ